MRFFSLGYADMRLSVCVCSIIRVVVLSRLEKADLTCRTINTSTDSMISNLPWPGNYVNGGIWTATEPAMGVVSACLPSLRPLFTRLVGSAQHGPTLKGIKNKDTRDSSSGWSSRRMWSRNHGDDDNTQSFTRLEEGGGGHRIWGHEVHVHGGKPSDGSPEQMSLEETQIPLRRIKVKTEVTLISTGRMEYRDQLF